MAQSSILSIALHRTDFVFVALKSVVGLALDDLLRSGGPGITQSVLAAAFLLSIALDGGARDVVAGSAWNA